MQLGNANRWVTCMNGLIWTKYKYSAFTSQFWVSLLRCHRLGQVEEIIIKLKHHVNLIPFEHLFKDGAFILIHWLNYVVNFRLFRPDIAKNERIVSNRECATYAFSGLNALLFDVFFLLKIFFFICFSQMGLEIFTTRKCFKFSPNLSTQVPLGKTLKVPANRL